MSPSKKELEPFDITGVDTAHKSKKKYIKSQHRKHRRTLHQLLKEIIRDGSDEERVYQEN